MLISDLIMLVRGEVYQARDHILGLVRDPAYFLQNIRDQEAHIAEVPRYLEELGKYYAEELPGAKITLVLRSKATTTDHIITGQACYWLITRAFSNLIMWSYIDSYAAELEGLAISGETCRSAREKSSLEIDEIFCRIQRFLSSIATTDSIEVLWAFPASPKMRKYFNTNDLLQSRPNVKPENVNISSLTPALDKMNQEVQWAY